MKKIALVLFICFAQLSCSVSEKGNVEKDKKEIMALLKAQEQAWSDRDLEGFMQGYWENDSLKFYSVRGVTYGWDQTLASYEKRYPTKDHSGTLNFKIDDISQIDKESYFVMGAYHLTRKIGDANGIFMIIFKKINGEWKIIADTSC